MKAIVLFFFSSLAFAQTTELIIFTEPTGAMLYEGSTAIGQAPVKRTYKETKNGIAETPLITAVWPSGAKDQGVIQIPMSSEVQKALISRPMDHPGVDKDMAWADQVTRKRQEEYAKAMELYRQYKEADEAAKASEREIKRMDREQASRNANNLMNFGAQLMQQGGPRTIPQNTCRTYQQGPYGTITCN